MDSEILLDEWCDNCKSRAPHRSVKVPHGFQEVGRLKHVCTTCGQAGKEIVFK